jgi:hypothetical protein
MWVFLSSRLRHWALVAIAVPLGRFGAQRLAGVLEQHHGPTPVTRTLRRVLAPLPERNVGRH